MQSSMLRQIAEDFGNGGTIDGDLIVTGDLQIDGGGSLSFDEIVQGTQVIDVTSTEALLVRKNADGGDVFIVDTTNSRVGIGLTPSYPFDVSGVGVWASRITNSSSTEGQGSLLVKSTSEHDGTKLLGLYSGSTYKVVVQADGMVGIGTASPAHAFHVHATSTVDNQPAIWLHNNHNAANKDGVVISTTNDGSDADVLHVRANNTTYNNGTSLMLVRGDGNVGIGTDTPQGHLDINTETAEATKVRINGETYYQKRLEIRHFNASEAGAENNMLFITSKEGDSGTLGHVNASATDVDVLTWKQDGNVGIGTDSPTSKLHVAGDTANGTYLSYINNTGSQSEDNGLHIKIASSGSGSHGLKVQTGGSANAFIVAGDGKVGLGFTTGSMTQTLNVNGGTYISGNVGIGTASPSDYASSGNNLVVGGSGHEGITILSGTAQQGSLQFGDGTGTDSYRGYIIYDQNVETMAFGTSAATRMVLDANSRISLSNNDASGDATCTLFGYQAGNAIADGDDNNTMIGHMAGLVTTGGSNTYLGFSAGKGTTGADNGNVGIGSSALLIITSASENVAIGKSAMKDANSAAGNVAIGTECLQNLTNGSNNVAIGKVALDGAGVNPSSSTAIGYSASRYAQGNSNVSLGHSALKGNNAGNFVGTNNIAIGFESMDALEVGEEYNIAIGSGAIGAMQEGSGGGDVDNNIAIGRDAFKGGDLAANDRQVQGNIAIGSYALDATADNAQTGTIAIGHQALTALTSGEKNTAVGYNTLSVNNDIGDSNTAVGYEALKNFDPASDGHGLNTAVGASAGEDVSTGTGNTLIGDKAGNTGTNDLTTGTLNTVVGQLSGVSASGATNQTVLGRGVTGVADNSVTLGNADVTRVNMSSDGAAVMYADGTINTSDRRFKENIEDTDLGLSFINSLRPVKYNFIEDKHDGKTKYGIIAQEVVEVLNKTGNTDFAGIKDDNKEKLGADYIQFIAPLMKAVQELSAKVEALENA